jgi:hypothetical protein
MVNQKRQGCWRPWEDTEYREWDPKKTQVLNHSSEVFRELVVYDVSRLPSK